MIIMTGIWHPNNACPCWQLSEATGNEISEMSSHSPILLSFFILSRRYGISIRISVYSVVLQACNLKGARESRGGQY